MRSLLTTRQDEAERLARRREQLGWTTYQLADRRVLTGLRNAQSQWSTLTTAERAAAGERFDQYAYQWY